MLLQAVVLAFSLLPGYIQGSKDIFAVTLLGMDVAPRVEWTLNQRVCCRLWNFGASPRLKPLQP